MAKRKQTAEKIVTRPTMAVTSASVSRTSDPTYSEIAARAYELFCERGGLHGDDLHDWLQAEHELRQLAATAA